MAEYLETTHDKFTFRVATDRLYTSEGLWIMATEPQGSSRFSFGLTDYLQQHSGDLAFAAVKPVGTKVLSGGECAEVETMKTALSLLSPLTGTIVAINAALEAHPELVNEDPYGKGWLAEIEASDWESDGKKLLDAPAYLKVMQAQIAAELK